jgi:hypothetical protein
LGVGHEGGEEEVVGIPTCRVGHHQGLVVLEREREKRRRRRREGEYTRKEGREGGREGGRDGH